MTRRRGSGEELLESPRDERNEKFLGLEPAMSAFHPVRAGASARH